MTEQLYRIERRPAKAGEVVAHWTFSTGSADADVLVPVPEVHNILWAWPRMVAGEELIGPNGETYRANRNQLQYHIEGNTWQPDVLYGDIMGDGWSVPASEPKQLGTTAEKDRHCICKMGNILLGGDKQCYDADAVFRAFKKLVDDKKDVPAAAPAPGTLTWAKATVAAGGAVYEDGHPLYRYDAEQCMYPNGAMVSVDWGGEAYQNGGPWHLWGDRDWLAALPDGTRVVGPHTGTKYTKRGDVLVEDEKLPYVKDLPIASINSSGWDLDRSPDSARDVAELRDQPVPDAFEWRNAANRWREQLADLERRVKELEGKA